MIDSPQDGRHIIGGNLFAALETDMALTCDGYKDRCTCQAVFIVKVHQIDQCKNPECDPLGNRSFILCPTCTALLARRTGELIGEMYTMLPDSDDTVECRCDTCGIRVLEMHDVFTTERLVPR